MGSTRTSQESDDELAQFLITIPNHNSYFSYFNPTRSSHDLPAESHSISQTQSFEGGFHPFTEKPPSITST